MLRELPTYEMTGDGNDLSGYLGDLDVFPALMSHCFNKRRFKDRGSLATLHFEVGLIRSCIGLNCGTLLCSQPVSRYAFLTLVGKSVQETVLLCTLNFGMDNETMHIHFARTLVRTGLRHNTAEASLVRWARSGHVPVAYLTAGPARYSRATSSSAHSMMRWK